MKPTLKKAYGLFNTDDRGYAQDKALKIVAIAAALNPGAYQTVNTLKLLQFEEVAYSMGEEIRDVKKIIGQFPAFVPTQAFYLHRYENGFDKSEFVVGEEKLIEYIKTHEYTPSIKRIAIIKDDEGGAWTLLNSENVVIEPFAMTREIAVANALNKLTEEEKKLLGLA